MQSRFLPGRLVILIFIGIVIVLNVIRGANTTALEIAAVGQRWLNGEILYAQVWSHFSPLLLFLGGLYSKYCGTLLARILFELCISGAILGSLAVIRAYISAASKKASRQPLFMYLIYAFLLILPGVWTPGVEPIKMTLFFGLMSLASAIKWGQSGQTYFAVKTWQHNPRWLLPVGLCAALAIFTTPFGVFIVMPSIYVCLAGTKHTLAPLGFYILSFVAVLWAHLSYFASYGLIQKWLDISYVQHLRLIHIAPSFNLTSEVTVSILVLGGALVFLSMWALRWQGRITFTWVYTLSVLIFVLLSQNIMTIFIAGILLLIPLVRSFKNFNIPYKLQLTGIATAALFAGALNLEAWQNKRLDQSRLDTMTGYVQQRIGTTKYTMFYGNNPDFYGETNLSNPTRFYDVRVFNVEDRVSLSDQFRGDMESSQPLFIIRDTSIQAPDRIQGYFKKHYYTVNATENLSLMKRKNTL